MKWIAPALAYLAVFLGLFAFHSAWAALLGFHAAILGSLWIARPNIPLSILLKNSNKKWIAVSLLVCGSSGFALFFLWNVFGIASDLPAQVEALGLNADRVRPMQGQPRSLLMDDAAAVSRGICFDTTVEGIRRCMADYGWKALLGLAP